jgi:hypothetical protein
MVAPDLHLSSGSSEAVDVRLYIDEVKPSTSPVSGGSWLYVGVLVIPESKCRTGLAILQGHRDRVGCDSEIHFTKLTSHGGKLRLAEAWLEEVLTDQRNIFRFHILGINVLQIQRSAFGDMRSAQDRRIYTRFLRPAIIYPLKSFFPGGVRVTRVFHDGGDLEHDPYFDWHTPWRIAKDQDSINFLVPEILFLNSDHRRESRFPAESHFIQLTDLIVGAVRQALDCPSGSQPAQLLGIRMLPLLERIMDPDRRTNPRSRYNHRNRCSVSFFPRVPLTLDQLADPSEQYRSAFFITRRCLQESGGTRQMTLGL